MPARLILSLSLALLACAAHAGTATPADAQALTFEEHIRPILKAHCFDCHGSHEDVKGSLDLRLRRLMVAGGDSGAAIVPGEPESSYLLERVRSGEMPPGDGRVSAEELATLERWIAAGAKTARPEPEKIGRGIGITPEERRFWAFQPILRPPVPDYPAEERVRTPIDALLLQAMRAHDSQLSFSPDADRRTLIRRVYFDLLGLPPAAEEVERFVADQDPDAYETLIDNLLASPHYGERWGRHWLDVAGYAESEGYTNDDRERPHAYKYRDYVIRSINDDKPFDQFIIEQLAGDELVTGPHNNMSPAHIEKLVATGFLRMAADGTESGGVDQTAARNQVIADTIKIVSSSLLGMTVGCAQCHDHRYDPITQEDYYRLRAIFEPAYDWKNWRTPAQRRISLYTDEDRAKAAEVEAEVTKIAAEKADKQKQYIADALTGELEKFEEPLRSKLRTAYETLEAKRTDEQKQLLKDHPSVNITPGVLYQYNQAAADDLKKYDERIAAVRAEKPVEDFIRALTEVPDQVPTTYLFHRGEPEQPKQPVTPGGLTVTAPPGQRFEILENDPSRPTTGRRLAFARWLTSGRHPLVTRVLVNRVWLHHFGRALVNTPGDFGRLGDRPTHPELLDWLADRFMADGWSLKRLHKQILLSTVYRQSSMADPARLALDPANKFYWRAGIRRLDAEVMRDRILATSGALADDMFGPSVAVKTDETGQVVVPEDAPRRSIYVQVRRTQPVALLSAFDAPVMEVNCTHRPSSTVATQSLMLMNGSFMLQQAARLAERVRREAVNEPPPEQAESLDLAELAATPWQYGYGAFDAAAGQVIGFQQLPHWNGSSWQGGPQLPDPELGWVFLSNSGGHPGDDHHAAIRRWIAPFDATVAVSGKLHHSSDKGDGVRGRVVSSRQGLLGEWMAHNGDAETPLAGIQVQRGETLDFMTDRRQNEGFDSFQWTIQLTGTPVAAQDAQASATTWDSQKQFQGPPPPPLPQQVARLWKLAYTRPASPDELQLALQFLEQQIDQLRAAQHADPQLQAMTNLCQTLLSSNEFLYVD